MDKIETKYIDALAKYLNTFSTEKRQAYTTEFKPLKKALSFIKASNKFAKIVFLDFGCGIGNVLFTAREILGKENKYIGIDTNSYYVDICQNIDIEFNILKLDILSDGAINLIKLSDVIFAYRPMTSFNEINEMYSNIDKNMVPGSYFICNDIDIKPNMKGCKIVANFKGIDCCKITDIRIYKKK